MKHLIRMTVLLLLTPAAWAASPFLPISATNPFRSGERAVVEQAVAQAEAQGKLVLIDMQAAWCGPCLSLEKDMEAKKAALQPTLDHFVYVKLEEMHLEMMAGADFLSQEIHWFPSLFVYNPASHKWSWLYASDADSLNQTLKDYLANGGVSALYLSGLTAKIQQGAKIEIDEVMRVLVPLSVESSSASLLTAVGNLLKAMAANPAQFNFTTTDFEDSVGEPYKTVMEREGTSLEAIRAVDANAFKDLATDYMGQFRMGFYVPIGRSIRVEGGKAASDKCSALASAVLGAMAAAPAAQKHELQVRMELQCLLLKVQLKESTGADVTAYVSKMAAGESDKFSYSLMRVFAATGTNFPDAINYGRPWQAAYEKNYAKNAELLARIIKATDARMAAYAAGKSHP